jgi:hypothetical protein
MSELPIHTLPNWLTSSLLYLSAAYMWVPTAMGPPSGTSVHVRLTASGRRVHGSVCR